LKINIHPLSETEFDLASVNPIALAYVGDAAYEILIRQHLVKGGVTRPNRLQHWATHYVSAKAQASLVAKMQADGVLTEQELTIFKRGRNANSHTHAKNTKISTYKISTGFEAIFGYLSLTAQQARLTELGQWCIEQVENGGLADYEFKD
jgi:ribonuclease-3 family protein